MPTLSFDLRRAWQCQGLHSSEMQTSKSDSCAPGRSRLWAQSRQTGREEPGIPVCSSSLTTTAVLGRQSRASPDPPQAAWDAVPKQAKKIKIKHIWIGKAVRELALSTCRSSASFSFYTTDGQRQECLPASNTNKSQCYLTLKKAGYRQGTPFPMWLLCSTLSHLGKELTEEEVGRRHAQHVSDLGDKTQRGTHLWQLQTFA